MWLDKAKTIEKQLLSKQTNKLSLKANSNKYLHFLPKCQDSLVREDLFWLFSNSLGSHLNLIWEKLWHRHVLSLPDLADLSLGSGVNRSETTLNKTLPHQSKDWGGLRGNMKHPQHTQEESNPQCYRPNFLIWFKC